MRAVAVCLGFFLVMLDSTIVTVALPSTGGAWLIAGRVVQGVGAAVLMPSSLALIRSTYPEPARQARIIGLWGGLGGVAAAAGPLLGGALLTVAGWPALFLLNVPFAGLVLCISGGLVDPPVIPSARVDVRGLVTSTCGLALLVAGCIARGTVLLGLFVALERRRSNAGTTPPCCAPTCCGTARCGRRCSRGSP